MRKIFLVAVLSVIAIPASAAGQLVQPVAVQFLSGESQVRGRFFPAATKAPIATLLLVPGWPGNPQDVLGLGGFLAARDVNVLMFNPRGLHNSEGTATFANTLDDIAAALRWLRNPETRERFRVDTARLALGGYSFGGGLAMAYAARDAGVRRVISIAGNDHAEFIRAVQRDPETARAIRQMLMSTRAPNGPVRFDMEAVLQELADHQDVYGLKENASRLADRPMLLIGGWEDMQVNVETILLPLYRALKAAGASDVTFLVYHDDHNFRTARDRLASDIRDWLARHQFP